MEREPTLTVGQGLQRIKRNDPEERRPTAHNPPTAVTFSPNGEYTFSGSDKGVRVQRVADGEHVATMATEHRVMQVMCLAVSKDGRRIAAGTNFGDMFVWDANTHKQDSVARGARTINGVDFSPDSSRLVSASDSCTATVWDTATRKRVQTLSHEDSVFAAKYSPQGDRIATATPRAVRVYDSNNGRLLVDIKVTVTPWYNTGLVWCNNHLLVVSKGAIKQFQASTGSPVSEWPVSHSDYFSCIALPKHRKFIAHSARRTVTFWDMATHTQLGAIQHPQDIRSIAFSPDDLSIAIGGRDDKTVIESLSRITASTRRQEQQDEQPSTSGGYGNSPTDLALKDRGTPGSGRARVEQRRSQHRSARSRVAVEHAGPLIQL
ncbi:WD40-repeat-containing domain protein [Boletus coccyginus]|nr:WD40-repeat-containing domain protein [Boletus coccyginus]